MIKPEQIPKEALGEMVRVLSDTGSYTKALAAAINAWPGIKLTPYWEHMTHKRRVEMILPLTENADG